MDKISIIVPVYKVEKYIARCIDSILKQTFSDFELILVDDGSPDQSGKICDDYANADSRIVVIHKENGGVAAARNSGIRVATGSYLCFVDSDDYINENYVARIKSAIDKYRPDLISFGLTYNGKSKRELLPAFPVEVVKSGIEFIEEEPRIFSKVVVPFSVRFCFQKSFVDRTGLLFNEKVKYAEDSCFNLMAIYTAKRMVCLDFSGYYYCFDSSGSSTNNYKPTMIEDSDFFHSEKIFVGKNLKSHYEYYLDMANVEIFSWIPSCIENEKQNCNKLHLKSVIKLVNTSFVQNCVDFYLDNNLCNRKLQKIYLRALKKKHCIILFLVWRFFPFQSFMCG